MAYFHSSSCPSSMPASSPGLTPVVRSSVSDPSKSGNFACGNGLLSRVFEFVHLFLRSIVLLEDEPENDRGDESCDGKTS